MSLDNSISNLNSSNHAQARSTRYNIIKFVSDLWQVGGFLGYTRFLHQENWLSWYNWNIVESGI